jgi:hypothetical protein
MLNDIINKVAEKTGISSDKAAMAVTTVVDFLKNKLPSPLASQLDKLLNGESIASDTLDQAKDAASDIFESAKEKLSSLFGNKK